MVTLTHFTGHGQFSGLKYIVDMSPNENIFQKHFNVQKKDREFFKEVFKKIIDFKEIEGIYYNKNFNFTITFYNNKTNIQFVYSESFNIKQIEDSLKEFECKEELDNLPVVNLLAIDDNGPFLIKKKLKSKILIDVENSYNLTYPLNKILSDIKSNKAGLMLLTGLPGTGKTSLIKYLTQENQDIKFVFINNSNLDILSNPRFAEFAISNLSDSVIILEDCEKALLTRDLNKGYDISTILNLTDGIIGDILNIKIIATLNTVDKIDSALLRKGRLICKCDFKKLTVTQANNLSKKLNKVMNITDEISLCEIFNNEDNGIQTEQSKTLGFSMS